MRIAMINGSPKRGDSNSGILLKLLEAMINTGNTITQYQINKSHLTEGQYIELCHADTLIFAFPLYIDAIPSHLFRMMANLESYLKREMNHKIRVYIMVNNGFYEGHQNHIVIDIFKNWCKRCGLDFGQGIGIGAGEMLDITKNVPPGKGPLKNLGEAMQSLSSNINSQSYGEDILFSPNFPHFAWKLSSTFFWHRLAKKNGLKRKDLAIRIET